MPVSILYCRTDLAAALAISEHLRLEGVTTCLEAIDTPADDACTVSARVRRNLHDCTHLIALVSSNTCNAWWVPFALGVACAAERRVTTFQLAAPDAPGYLHAWPRMARACDLDLFISAYRLEHTLGRLHGTDADNNAQRFHADLKTSIGRGY